MVAQDALRDLLKPDRARDYDFSQLPGLLTLRDGSACARAVFGEDAERWTKMQETFTAWATDPTSLSEATVRSRTGAFDTFFAKRGFLRGRVLDVGGGWGLFRQWWEPGPDGLFVVHDPGVERFLQEPSPLHQELYERALSLSMTFVEGFGESLPYQDQVFDTCLVANTLYHCVQPGRVVAEAARCLTPSGRIVVITDEGAVRPEWPAALLGHVRHPRRMLGIVRRRLTKTGIVIRHLSAREMEALVDAGGLADIESIPPVPGTTHFHALIGTRPAASGLPGRPPGAADA